MSRIPAARLIALLVVALVLAIDQSSKQWALSALGKVGSTVHLPGPLDLTLMFNYSSAFGLVPVSGGFTRWGLAALNLVVAAILIRVVARHTATRLSTVALASIIAGAIGNALDRIRLGAVVDMFDASKLGFVWIFNVADVAIDIGIALLLLTMVMTRAGYDRLFVLVAFWFFMSTEPISFAAASPSCYARRGQGHCSQARTASSARGACPRPTVAHGRHAILCT